ncbi:MAG: hypothetical protein ACK5BN_09485, partial [Planctomycetota bacterium]
MDHDLAPAIDGGAGGRRAVRGNAWSRRGRLRRAGAPALSVLDGGRRQVAAGAVEESRRRQGQRASLHVDRPCEIAFPRMQPRQRVERLRLVLVRRLDRRFRRSPRELEVAPRDLRLRIDERPRDVVQQGPRGADLGIRQQLGRQRFAGRRVRCCQQRPQLRQPARRPGGHLVRLSALGRRRRGEQGHGCRDAPGTRCRMGR